MRRNMKTFESELIDLLNRYSVENQSNTPDHILANYMVNCLNAYTMTITSRDGWYGFKPFTMETAAKGVIK